jgi:hypothetical protein
MLMRFFKAKRWTKEEVLAIVREEWTTQKVADIAVEAAKRFDEANPYKKPLDITHAHLMGLVEKMAHQSIGRGDVVFLQVAEKVAGSRNIQLKQFSDALAHYLRPYGCNVVLIPHDARVQIAKREEEAPPACPEASVEEIAEAAKSAVEFGNGVHRP